jgi:hypothetical protein
LLIAANGRVTAKKAEPITRAARPNGLAMTISITIMNPSLSAANTGVEVRISVI